jgi:glycosyltransferase domain-containing protein
MITLVIPTRNRPHYLARLLRYYDDMRFQYSIIVADSSSASDCELNREIVNSVKDRLNVNHCRYDSNINFYLKCAKALETADTKYAVFCADDDFIIPQAIAQGISFLEDHDDYSEVHGHAVMLGSLSATYNDLHHGLCASTYSQRPTLDDDDPITRLEKYYSLGTVSFYSIHRRLNIIRNMLLAGQYTSVSYPHFGELLLDGLSVLQGKSKFIDMFYMVRQLTPDRESLKVIPWEELLLSDALRQEYEKYCDCQAAEINRLTGRTMPQAREIINRGFPIYTSSARRRGALSKILSRVSRVIRLLPGTALFALHRGRISRMLRSPRETLRLVENERDKLSIDKLLDRNFPFHCDFLPIYECMIHYPQGEQRQPNNISSKTDGDSEKIAKKY